MPNQACPDYGKLQSDQTQPKLKKLGKTRRGVQRYQCKSCGKTFTETTGTIFYRKKAQTDEILEVLALLAEGNRISTITRVKGIKEDTILRWLREATHHAQELEAVLLKDFHHKRAQIDGLWSFVQNKGEKNYPETDESGSFWISTLIDMDSRLRVCRGVGKDETEASLKVFQTIKQRGHPDGPPPLISDGWGGIDEAMLAVYGLIPDYSGRGRPPSRPKPAKDWLYLQMVKHRDEHGRLLDVELKAIWGKKAELMELLGKSTAYIERDNLTTRLFNARLTRKTLAFSKDLSFHEAAVTWEDAYYNLVHSHKGLRLRISDGSPSKWMPRTQAVVAKVTIIFGLLKSCC